ncbi:hypothetical protein [Nonomuraea basaltis]|uniref:hypothetical protein n=1 Tax=Nonomuraea basaltis TaxID=2495887 RepID=UPI00110C4C3A|nr:hypothetical protein [Nonomuraea basaltis]TMR92422.1 hypothetical protein EJK15_44895 [Nonomuraea basaltis]
MIARPSLSPSLRTGNGLWSRNDGAIGHLAHSGRWPRLVRDFADWLFTVDKPLIRNKEGITTTPFDVAMLNDIDPCHLS